MANASLIENFLESLASEKGLSKNTIQSYSLDIKQCLKITKLNIDKISSKNLNLDIEKYICPRAQTQRVLRTGTANGL